MPSRIVARTLNIAAVLAIGLVATAVFVNLFHSFHMDFISFWAAAQMAVEGRASEVYDIAQHHAVQTRAFATGAIMPFSYPPPFLILVLPFGLLPYGIAAGLWITASYAAYWLATRRLAPGSGAAALAFPPAVTGGIIGQSALAANALLIGAMACLARRPLLAGLLFGCLIIKPQLGLFVPVALIAGREWRAFAGAALSSLGLMLLALLLFGAKIYQNFLAALPLMSSIVAEGRVGWHKMAGVYPALSLAGAPPMLAWTAHILAALTALTFLWWIWRRDDDPLLRGSALAIATALGSPYLFHYDTVALVLALIWLARNGEKPGLLALLWSIALAGLVLNWLPETRINPAPLLPLLAMALIRRRLRRPASAGQAALGAA